MKTPTKKAAIMAVCSRKGGVGKTTCSVNLAVYLSCNLGRRVLLLDLDPQGHVTSSLASALPSLLPSRGTGAALSSRDCAFSDIISPASLPNLHLLMTDGTLADMEILLNSKAGREFFLRSALKSCLSSYDLIVIDCPPNMGTLTMNAIMAADVLLIPTDLSPLSFQGILDIHESVDDLEKMVGIKPGRVDVLISKKDGRNKVLGPILENELKRIYGPRLFDNAIPYSSLIVQASARGMSIFHHAPGKPVTRAFKSVALELVERLDL